MCVLVYVKSDDQNTHFICNVSTFLGSEDTLAGPDKL